MAQMLDVPIGFLLAIFLTTMRFQTLKAHSHLRFFAPLASSRPLCSRQVLSQCACHASRLGIDNFPHQRQRCNSKCQNSAATIVFGWSGMWRAYLPIYSYYMQPFTFTSRKRHPSTFAGAASSSMWLLEADELGKGARDASHQEGKLLHL